MIMGQYGSGVKIGQTVSESLGNDRDERKFWIIFFIVGIALGDIAFACSYAMIVHDFQMDPHRAARENRRMTRATVIGILTATFFYMAVMIVGYMIFGNNIWMSGNILQSFKNPCWLVAIDFATACVIVLLIGAYQKVYPMLVNQFLEKRFPNCKWLSKSIFVRIPGLATLELNLLASWRIMYIVTMTMISMVSPSLNDVLGILQDIGFCAFTVYFPLTIFTQLFQIRRFGTKWIGLQILSFVAFLVFSGALMGFIEGIYINVKHILQMIKAS